MIKHPFVGNAAFQTLHVELWVLPECFWAVRAPAKVHLLIANLHLDGRIQWFFSQASWADNEVIRFLEVLLGISDEQVNAPLATEMVFLTVMAVRSRLLFGDS